MSIWDDYWKHIDNQLTELRTATTAADVIRICPPVGENGDGFFGGGGGDELPDGPLHAAGWRYRWVEASYYWCMVGPTGDHITYIEGDLYAKDTRPFPHGMPS